MENSYAKIKLAAKHNQLILVKDQIITAGNSNSVFIEFILRTDDWLTCDKIKAVFNNYYVRDISNNLVCDIPVEVIATPGKFEVGLFATNGNIRLVTNPIEFTVNEGIYGGICSDSTSSDDVHIYDGGGVEGYPTEEEVSRLVIYDGGGVHGY